MDETETEATRPLRIFFLIRSLDTGGANRQLVALARGLHDAGHEVQVGVFYSSGALQEELGAAGVPVIDLKKTGRWDTGGFIRRLVRAMKKVRPDIFYGFLGTPNMLGVLLKPLFPRMRVVWGVRASNMDLSKYDRATRISYDVERRLSRFAHLIICNSQAGLEHAERMGFPSRTMCVVYNGIDTERFRPDLAARRGLRAEWGVADDEILIGLLARVDPMKDHATFIRAAALMAETRPVRFAAIGSGPDDYVAGLRRLGDELGLGNRFLWIEEVQDAPAALNALDLSCSSSVTEGFSNAVAEAMACGLPCVVTDVGDSALLVGDTGWVVPHSDPEALAAALVEAVGEVGSDRGERARRRIVENFSVTNLVDTTADLLRDQSGGAGPSARPV